MTGVVITWPYDTVAVDNVFASEEFTCIRHALFAILVFMPIDDTRDCFKVKPELGFDRMNVFPESDVGWVLSNSIL